MEPFVDYMNSFAVRVGNIYGYDSNALELAKAVKNILIDAGQLW